MKRGTFGNTSLEVSRFGLGCARIGGIFQGDTGGYLRLLAAARDAGVTFYDTADMYSQGESERLVGRAFRGQRDRVVIASKAGYCLPAQRKLAARLKPLLRPLVRRLGLRRERLPSAVRGAITQDFSPGYLRGAVEGSLRRLGTDYLDLLQLHSPPAEIVRRGEWVEALDRMQSAGMIRYYGISCDDVAAGLAALEHARVASIQCVVNLLDPSSAEQLVPRARAQRVACIARECLANGLLVKDEKDIDFSKYAASPEEAERKRALLAGARERAVREGVSLTTLSLTHVSSLQGIDVTLIGARNVEQLHELLRSIPA
jgi:aryl-alcohol dehydrogenase-like predicted oxidoreductase